MKTLRQWYDSLSENAQLRIQDKCFLWFDAKEPDCYRKRKIITREQLTSLLAMQPDQVTRDYQLPYGSNPPKRLIQLFTLGYMADNGLIDVNIVDNYIINSMNKYDDIPTSFLFVSEKNRRKAYETYIDYKPNDSYSRLDFWEYLYLIDDFDKLDELDWNSQVRPLNLDTITREIIGEVNSRTIAMRSYAYLSKYLEPKEECPLFDELFFGDNGWSDYDKQHIIDDYLDSRKSTLTTTEDFIWRFVCVDPKKYLPKLYNIIKVNTAIGTAMFTQKKPLKEIQEKNLKGEDTYKYGRVIRAVAKIANACARKSISTIAQKQLKEYGPLVKLYGYDFHTIYNAMEIDL